jgi:hypothetical protein
VIVEEEEGNASNLKRSVTQKAASQYCLSNIWVFFRGAKTIVPTQREERSVRRSMEGHSCHLGVTLLWSKQTSALKSGVSVR